MQQTAYLATNENCQIETWSLPESQISCYRICRNISELNNSHRSTVVHIGCALYVHTMKYIEHSLPYRRLEVSSNSKCQQLLKLNGIQSFEWQMDAVT
jgi:hypothetical protein